MDRKTVLLAAILFFLAGSLSGQSYYFRHYQVENGLSNNAVICSVQDKNGFLWLGTKDGLNRFDGYTFKIFRHDPDDTGSLGSNFVHSLYEDARGTLWVGTESGLYRYDASSETFRRISIPVNDRTRDIKMDRNGNLWFISGLTLYKYNEAKEKLQQYPLNRFFEAVSLSVSPDGTLWVSTSSGFLKRHDALHDSFTSYDVFYHSPPTDTKWIEKIYCTTSGTILIGTSNQGAKLFDTKTSSCKDILVYNPDKTEIFVRNFIQVSADEIWMATETGIFIYNTGTGKVTNLRKRYNNPYSISDNAVYTFCKDREGGIWAGTYFGGLNYYPREYTRFKKSFPKTGENSLSGNVVREIHQDRYGQLWIGTEDAGLNKYDTSTGRFTHFQPGSARGSISYSNIHGLLVTGDQLWIGTFVHGLDILNIRTGKVIQHFSAGPGPRSLKSNFIYCIYQTTTGEIMLGTTTGAYTYNRQSNDFSLLQGMPLHNWYTSLLKDEKGIVWAATYGNGVNYYNTVTKDSGNFRYDDKNKNSLADDRVNLIFEDSHKNLWFATEGGLCKLNRATNSFLRYTTKDGFPSNFMLSILEDEYNKLWISTTKGLVCFNPENGKLSTYTRANGILNDQFNFSSAYKDANGKMYFGSVKGLISFHPKELTGSTFVPPVFITGFQVDNKELLIAKGNSPLQKSITYTDRITLPYDQSSFSIDFAALSFTSPERSEYAYKMENLDKAWTYLKRNRKAYFTKLSPGTYHFTVKASNFTGVWNEQETRLTIEITPPWWASWWAYCLYILSGIGVLYWIVRGYHRRIEEKNRRKMELLEVAKEKEIFQAKIEFFTNVAHEIKTPLTLIRGPLEKVIRKAGDSPDLSNSLKIMERNTKRLIDLTNELLDFRQTEIKGFRLNFVKANIPELIEETYSNFRPLAEQKNLTFHLDLPPEPLYAYIDLEAFNKILNNLFSNAVKYAETKVFVRLLAVPEGHDAFTIELENDGFLIPFSMKDKIFEPFFRIRETEKQKGTGIGLALCRSLAQLHKGSVDLKATTNHVNTFVLTLPIHQQHEFNLQTRTKKRPITNEKKDA